MKKAFTVSRQYEQWSYTLIKNTFWKLIRFQPFWCNMDHIICSRGISLVGEGNWRKREVGKFLFKLERTKRSWKVSLQSKSSGWSWIVENLNFKWTCYSNWKTFQFNCNFPTLARTFLVFFNCPFQLHVFWDRIFITVINLISTKVPSVVLSKYRQGTNPFCYVP